ncbi:hypothetical protein FQN57_005868 [Myotisia sp. PD_48]|nr:hypothetical protein FQN57_005868 [Myotisia sp. PD_48]
MAPFFQRRLRCFYCGGASKKIWKNTVRSWNCEQCQATNHLDENGEITDPPVAEAASQKPVYQYAQPVSRPTEPDSNPTESSIFCSMCLKNQHILTETLASYLPSPSHPEYAAYEASYPSYRKSLEARYPQVCENCKPRVVDRIRQTGYEAKTDHLRRMMERSKGQSRKTRYWEWKSLLVSTGALAFWASVTGQLACDFLESIILNYPETVSSLLPPAITRHLSEPIKHLNFSEDFAWLQPCAGLSLVLGAFSLWWNPKLSLKVAGHHGRLVGLREYYRVQIVALMVRFMAWAGLQDPAITGLHPQLRPSIHLFVGIFTILATIVSRASIKFEKKPLVNWQDGTENLLEGRRRSIAAPEASPPVPQASQASVSTVQPSHFQRFPISNLAPRLSPTPEPNIPLTPPRYSIDDVDAMDWTPSQKSTQFTVNSSFHQTQDISTSSSFFKDQVISTQTQSPWLMNNSSFGQPTKPEKIKQTLYQPSATPELGVSTKDLPNAKPEPSTMFMAAPRFFPKSDLVAETGLEHIFNQAFSIRDESSKGQSQQSYDADSLHTTAFGKIELRTIKFVSLLALLVFCPAAQFYNLSMKSIETVVLGISFLVTGFSLVESLMKPLAIWRVKDILISFAQLILCICLAMHQTSTHQLFTNFQYPGFYLAAIILGPEIISLGPWMIPQKPSIKATTEPEHPSPPQLPPPAQVSDMAGKQPLSSHSSINSSFSFGIKQPKPQAKQPAPPPNVSHDTVQPSFSSLHTRGESNKPKLSAAPKFQNSTPKRQTLSFSPSFDSTLQDDLFSPASTTFSSAGYESSIASEPQSPIAQPRFTNVNRGVPSPSILKSLSLDDRPIPPPRLPTTLPSRYSLRNRRA